MTREQERNYYLETLARMEQDIAMVDLTAAAASISISLRRIADVLEAREFASGDLVQKLWPKG